MFDKKQAAPEPLSTGGALRHLLVFQLKLAMDALRDLLLSPLSIVVFVLDALRQPTLEDSLYLKLMQLGRRSDRLINLFDEYSDVSYTVDQAVSEVEQALAARREDSASEREDGKG